MLIAGIVLLITVPRTGVDGPRWPSAAGSPW